MSLERVWLLILVLVLIGCAPETSQGTPDSPPRATQVSTEAGSAAETDAPGTTPTSDPTMMPTPIRHTALRSIPPDAFPVKSGEILFVRDGVYRAIGDDGSDERVLGEAVDAFSLSAVSPDGRYAAGWSNSGGHVIDLQNGHSVSFAGEEMIPRGNIRWLEDSSTLYFATNRQIWRTAPFSEREPQMMYETDSSDMVLGGYLAYTPLPDGRLLIQVADTTENYEAALLLFDPESDASDTLLTGYTLLDAAADLSRLLLVKHEDELASGAVRRIYTADFDAENGVLSSPEWVKVEIDIVSGWAADIKFTLDPDRIIAAPSNGQGEVSFMVIQPLGASYGMILLDGFGRYYDGRPVNYDDEHIVAARSRAQYDELWLLPLDGSEGTLLTIGSAPHVVP